MHLESKCQPCPLTHFQALLVRPGGEQIIFQKVLVRAICCGADRQVHCTITLVSVHADM